MDFFEAKPFLAARFITNTSGIIRFNNNVTAKGICFYQFYKRKHLTYVHDEHWRSVLNYSMLWKRI